MSIAITQPVHARIRWSPTGTAVPLRCLGCDKPFLSEHKGVRCCGACRSEDPGEPIGSVVGLKSTAGSTAVPRELLTASWDIKAADVLADAKREAAGRVKQTWAQQRTRELRPQEGPEPVTPEEKARRRRLEEAIVAGDATAVRIYRQRYGARLVVSRGRPVAPPLFAGGVSPSEPSGGECESRARA